MNYWRVDRAATLSKAVFIFTAMEGWIKLHRQILEWEWFDDDGTFKVFVWLLLNANHEPQNWHGLTIERGQFVTSLENISVATKRTVRNVRTILNRLKSTNELTIKTTNKYSIITICNYGIYQQTDTIERQTNRQAKRQTNDKQTTGNRQTNDIQTTTNNNDKNVKNEKKDVLIYPTEPENFESTIDKEFQTATEYPKKEKGKSCAKKEKEPKQKYGEFNNVELTDTEAQKLHNEFGDDAAGMVEYLSAYKIEKNYKTKSDYLTIKRWVADAYNKQSKSKQNGNIGANSGNVPIERIVAAGRAWANAIR